MRLLDPNRDTRKPLHTRAGLQFPRRILGLAAVGILLGSLPLASQSKGAGEYEIKAAFLYNFARFVEWPPNAWSSPEQPFKFCVLGMDPFGRALDNAILGKTIADRPVSLAKARHIQELADCQILFVSSSEMSHWPEVLKKLQGANVLIVGETEDFTASGGTVQFVAEGNHVRFAINPDAAERAKLKISSKLLALAVVVRDGSRPSGERH